MASVHPQDNRSGRTYADGLIDDGSGFLDRGHDLGDSALKIGIERFSDVDVEAGRSDDLPVGIEEPFADHDHKAGVALGVDDAVSAAEGRTVVEDLFDDFGDGGFVLGMLVREDEIGCGVTVPGW